MFIVSDVTMNDKFLVTATDQQITCYITDISEPATVIWKDQDGLSLIDVEGYTISQGTVTNGTQHSVLNITSPTLLSLESSTVFSCVVRSSVYPNSSSSVTKNMTLNTLIFGVEAVNTEVGTSTESVVTCIISGITQAVTSFSWTDDSGTQLTNDTTDYLITDDGYNGDINSQTTTLTVKNGVTTDSIFSCVVTSDEWLVSNNVTEVIFNIFGEYNKLHAF